eukprot:scaffold304_cov248-Pinguiococcus_pyrenoidosus.AAC.25
MLVHEYAELVVYPIAHRSRKLLQDLRPSLPVESKPGRAVQAQEVLGLLAPPFIEDEKAKDAHISQALVDHWVYPRESKSPTAVVAPEAESPGLAPSRRGAAVHELNKRRRRLEQGAEAQIGDEAEYDLLVGVHEGQRIR